MGRYLEEPDRALRQEAWELVAKRRLQEADKFDDIFDEQIKLRAQIAKNAGFGNYRDYAFRRLGRFDYTPDDCAKFHDAVEKEVMPVVRELQARAARADEAGKTAPVGFVGGPAEPSAAETVRRRSAKWFRARRKFSICSTANLRAVSSKWTNCICSIWTIARARRRAAINPRCRNRGCRSFS